MVEVQVDELSRKRSKRWAAVMVRIASLSGLLRVLSMYSLHTCVLMSTTREGLSL